MISTKYSYKRFVIISSHRSGSNYLSSLLSSHPNVMSIGEIYNPSVLFADPGKPMLHGNQMAKILRDIAPVWFLQRYVYCTYPPQIQAVGFRYFYLHAQGKFQPVLKYLINEKDIHIIHLKRNNLLRSYWSLRAAQETGVWTVPSSSTRTQPTIRLVLKPGDVASYFTTMETFMNTFDTYFQNHTTLEVEYEQLLTNSHHHQKKLTTFLGVSPRPLYASTKRLNNRPLYTIITNYPELKSYFRSTKWSHFFTE